MVGTVPGQLDKDFRRRGLVYRLATLVRRATGRSLDHEQVRSAAISPVVNPTMPENARLPDLPGPRRHPGCVRDRPVDFRWRRHPQLRQRFETGPAADPHDVERGARSAAVRGLFLARGARFDDARASFAAGAAESSVDLTAIPGFWDLPRAGMLAAVDAYDDVGRFRDAAALGARIRLTYRPRSVSHVGGTPRSQESG